MKLDLMHPAHGGIGRLTALLTAAGVALLIFAVDTLVPFEFAVAVLYVLVVVIAAMLREPRTVVAVAALCGVLTIVSWLVVHRFMIPDTATLRAGVSLAAIVATSALCLRNIAIQEQVLTVERQRANFARYFPSDLVDDLTELDVPLSLARRIDATVMFADVIGFTAMACKLQPEDVITLLRELHAVLSHGIFANRGTIDKFLGDGVIAVFGASNCDEPNATNAVRASFDILRAVEVWNGERRRSGKPDVTVAVGLHFGAVILGNVGSERRLELTVLGDTVNLANRIEAYCRDLGVDLLMTEAVVAAIERERSTAVLEHLTELGMHQLRGFGVPVRLFGYRKGEPSLRPAGRHAAEVIGPVDGRGPDCEPGRPQAAGDGAGSGRPDAHQVKLTEFPPGPRPRLRDAGGALGLRS
ncbi:adenylate/guanylate cyclase domain-containing protein [Enterovirga sp. CN4-39]|uniref:adenylate/guanylate cyclase domain-containing protein n=1 Tax=Enterovirga sp. CN4-39 TaxID=3400910 RepID=UPI003C07689C